MSKTSRRLHTAVTSCWYIGFVLQPGIHMNPKKEKEISSLHSLLSSTWHRYDCLLIISPRLHSLPRRERRKSWWWQGDRNDGETLRQERHEEGAREGGSCQLRRGADSFFFRPYFLESSRLWINVFKTNFTSQPETAGHGSVKGFFFHSVQCNVELPLLYGSFL